MSLFKAIAKIRKSNMKKLSIVSYDTLPNYPSTSEGLSENLSLETQIELMRMF